MGDFTALTIDTGVGDIHLNRFRVAFQPSAGTTAATLASDFIDNFPTYLRSEFAIVQFDRHTHEGKPTLHFHGYAKLLGIDLAAPHTDWVVREWVDRNVGFTAQTLKREFADVREDFPVDPFGGMLALVGPVVGAVVTHYNRMHFLAGRRSWRIGEGTVFGLSGDVIVLETVAVERFSAEAYNVGNWVIGLESKIPDIWITLLNNFVNKKGLTATLQTLKPRWKNKIGVDYLQLSFDDIAHMKAEPEYIDIYKLYPTIIP